MERLQGFILTVQKMVSCKYHLNPPSAISIYGLRYQAWHYCIYAVSPDGSTFLFTTKITSPLCKFLGIYSQSNKIDSFEIKFDKNVILGCVYMRPEIKSNLNEIWIHDKRNSVYTIFHCGRNETNLVSGVTRDKRPIKWKRIILVYVCADVSFYMISFRVTFTW